MAAKKAFGIPISPIVFRQLEARKEILKDPVKIAEKNMLLHNKGSWCRVVSGVDSQIDNENEFTPKLASNYILQGGTLKNSKDSQGKSTTKLREGLNFMGNFLDEGNESSYVYDEISGFRPMIGIDSFQVQSQGSYGTLKKADIGFKVWTLEQLDAMEQLFFRPGFNILVEYGSAAYLDSESTNLDINTIETSIAQDFLDKTKTLSQLDKKITELEEETCHNYSAFLGRIINFSWSYNSDGGFDCSVQIQAKGEIVESLKLFLPDNKDSGLKDFVKTKVSKTPDFTITKALRALKISGKNEEFAKKFLLDLEGKHDEEEFIVTRSNRFNVEGLETEASADEKYEPGTSYENQFVFTTLGTLLSVCNNFLVPENEKGEKETFFRTKRYENKLSSSYITFPGHVAFNPSICMVPKKEGKGVYLSDLELYGGYTGTTKYPNELNDDRLENSNVYHILVNIDHAIETLTSMSKAKDLDKQNVFTFLKSILGDINANLGGINQFDLDLDKTENEWRVVDRNYYDPEKSSKDNFNILDLVGLGSLVTNFSLSSKISGELTNMLAISAAVSGDDKNLDAMSSYNIGVKDRYKDKLDTGPAEKNTSSNDSTTDDSSKEQEIALEYGAAVSNIYAVYSRSKKLDRESFINGKVNHQQFTSKAYKLNQRSVRQKGQKAPFKGIIPMDLKLSIEGISGLKVGEAFRVNNNVFPARYANKVGFIITGITDQINSNNQWVTDIDTKMFTLPATEVPDPAFKISQDKLKKQKEDRRKLAKASLSAESAGGTRGQENVKAMYGQPGEGPFTTLVVPKGFNLTYDGKPVSKIRNVHSKVSSNLRQAFEQILSSYGAAQVQSLKINVYSGTYNKRVKRGGTTWSMHSWGIAIDLYYAKNKLRTKAPEAAFSKPEYKNMIDIFERNGFYSLGRAKNYDYMHFQAWDPNQKE